MELNSAYRNRHEDPNPAEFVVEIAQSGQSTDVFTSKNPISLNYPIYGFHGFPSRSYTLSSTVYPDSFPGPSATVGNTVEGSFTGGTPAAPVLDSAAYDQAELITDYFAGATLQRVTPAAPATVLVDSALITAFDPVSARVTLATPLNSLSLANDSWVVSFGTTPYTITDTDTWLYVLGGSDVDNYYTGMYIEDINLNQDNPADQSAREIIAYDGATRKASLASNLANWSRTFAGDPALNSLNHNYLIRPAVSGLVRAPVSYTAPNYSGGTGAVAPAKGCVYSVSITTKGTGYTAVSQAVDTGTFRVTPGIGVGGSVETVEISNCGLGGGDYTRGQILTLTGGNADCTLTVTGIGYGVDLTNASGELSGVHGEYDGDFLYVPSRYLIIDDPTAQHHLYPGGTVTLAADGGVGPWWPGNHLNDGVECASQLPARVSTTVPRPETGTRKIRKYVVDTTQAVTHSVVLDLPLAADPPENTYFEVHTFTKDGYSGLDYAGAQSTSTRGVFDVELREIIIPKIALASGGTIQRYSYLYVELQNVSGGVGGLVGSNNPNANTATYRVAVENSWSDDSGFLKFRGDGVVQKMQFRQNASIKFRIFKEGGETLTFVKNDYAPPCEPLDEIQVSALFECKLQDRSSEGIGANF